MSIELTNRLSNPHSAKESTEEIFEFDRRMEKAQTMPSDKINPQRVKKEWDNASSDFYRDHLTLNVFCYESIRSLKQRRVVEHWSPSNHMISRMRGCLNRMKIANEYAKRRDSLERTLYFNQDRGFWLPCIIISLDVGISAALIGLLFENAFSQLYQNLLHDNSTSVNTTSIGLEDQPYLRSFGPILRISLNILSIGFGRIKEKIEKRVDKYNQRLGLLEHVLGVRDQKLDNLKFDSDLLIEDFKAKLEYWEGLSASPDLNTIKSLLALNSTTIEERLNKALAQLNSWGVEGGGFKKHSWIGDDLSTMYISEKEATNDGGDAKKCTCGKLFRSSTKYRIISFKGLLKIKQHINEGREHITEAVQSATAKIEDYEKTLDKKADLNLLDELKILNTQLEDLNILFSRLRDIPKEDPRKVKKLVEMEKGIKLGVELAALLIIVYDQYSELVGDPIPGVVFTAFFIYFIAFVLARSTECVNGERRRQGDLSKEVAVILKLDSDYVPEIEEMRDYLNKYQAQVSKRKEHQLFKEADDESHLNNFATTGILDVENSISSLGGGRKSVDLTRRIDQCGKDRIDVETFFKSDSGNGIKPFVALKWAQNRRAARECKLPTTLFPNYKFHSTLANTDFDGKFEEKDAQFC